MNRKIWKENYFTNNKPINYPCPKCFSGSLLCIKVHNEITPTGKHYEEYGYDQGIEHIFNATLSCNNKDCKEIFSLIGKSDRDITSINEFPDGSVEEHRYSMYYPKFFFPNLRLIELDESIPEKVKEQINLSFSHYFNDLSSCANRIRNAIELILDDLKATKSRFTRRNKLYKFKTLHERIKHFENKNKNISKLLLALKIIGNEGSHIGKVEKDDILDAYEILAVVLDHTYTKNSNRISDLASEIIEQKKPRSKK